MMVMVLVVVRMSVMVVLKMRVSCYWMGYLVGECMLFFVFV